MPKARAHLLISGRVQGVFYRAFTEEVGLSLGLTGWVRNISGGARPPAGEGPGGSVEAVFEGEKENIMQAIGECHKGPPAARVDSIDVKWEEFRDEFDSFHVRYY